MTGEVKAESKELFTTLSTTTRRVTINQEPFLISDTVGFISKLPAYMIDAFRSTLEELNHTDIIVIVIDISDSVLELKKKFSSCMRTLSDLEIRDEKMIYALNKSDLIETEEFNQKVDLLNLTEQNNWISVSAKTGNNVKELKELVKNIIENNDPQKFKINASGGETGFGN